MLGYSFMIVAKVEQEMLFECFKLGIKSVLVLVKFFRTPR